MRDWQGRHNIWAKPTHYPNREEREKNFWKGENGDDIRKNLHGENNPAHFGLGRSLFLKPHGPSSRSLVPPPPVYREQSIERKEKTMGNKEMMGGRIRASGDISARVGGSSYSGVMAK
mgnify:CR=1 FL=1|tara:strand:- start:132 stop:485 length:354 start_codon:yes stop_codon:yes gene_type:complete